MLIDDIEFNNLNRADTLLLALLRPRLWSKHLGADALADADLRERLTRETARRAACAANERARLAFEQSEDSPFPNPTRQSRLDELAAEIALESLRCRWLQRAATEAGRAQLRIIENLPMRTNNAHAAPRPSWAKIALSLTIGFGDQTAMPDEVGAFIADHLQREKTVWGVTLTPVRICYHGKDGARDEAGIGIGLISDPRNPLGDYELAHRALNLADQARQTFGQHRLCISFPDCVVMLEGDYAPSP